MNKFREITPNRSYTGDQLTPYGKYKDKLRTDFNKRCAYTDSPDRWFGGKRSFHIDHLKPKSIYPDLECDYTNLVYSCSYVNQKKSKYNGVFLDPCETDYNQFFFRDTFGNIMPNESSEVAKEMAKLMGLSLRRYGLIWQLEQLDKKLTELNSLIEKMGKKHPSRLDALELYHETNEEFRQYFEYLGAEQ